MGGCVCWRMQLVCVITKKKRRRKYLDSMGGTRKARGPWRTLQNTQIIARCD